MKKAIKLIVMGVLQIMCIGLFVGCGDYKPTEQAQSGAYYSKRSATEYAVVYDDTLSVFYSYERCDVFQFAKSEDVYTGENPRAKATIKFLGDELIISIADKKKYPEPSKKLHLKRNPDIGLSQTSLVEIEPPKDVEINSHDLTWTFENLKGTGQAVGDSLRNIGILGAGVEVKYADKQDFELIKVRDFYTEPDCFFYIYFPDLNLLPGENNVKIMHVGGAFIQDNKIYKSENSEAISFSITVDLQGNFTAVKI